MLKILSNKYMWLGLTAFIGIYFGVMLHVEDALDNITLYQRSNIDLAKKFTKYRLSGQHEEAAGMLAEDTNMILTYYTVTSESMVDGWPDALKCVKEHTNYRGFIFYLHEVKPDLITYQIPNDLRITISFNKDKTWKSYDAGYEYLKGCIDKTIDQLIAEK